MVEKLPHEGRAGGVLRVVTVAVTQSQISDQQDRSFGKIIFGVEKAARLAEFGQRGAHRVGGRCERREPKHSPEVVAFRMLWSPSALAVFIRPS